MTIFAIFLYIYEHRVGEGSRTDGQLSRCSDDADFVERCADVEENGQFYLEPVTLLADPERIIRNSISLYVNMLMKYTINILNI